MTKTRGLLAVALLLCHVAVGHADTSDAVRELRSTPITAFDLGLFSLRQALKERFFTQGIEIEMPEKELRQYSTGAGYNAATGALTIFAIGYDYPTVPLTWNFAAECDQVIRRLRYTLGYNPEEGALFKQPSVLMDHFLENFRGQLDGDIAEVTIITFTRAIGGRIHECSGRLMSSDLQISNQ